MKNRHDSGTVSETPEQLIEHISRLMSEAEAMIAGPASEQGDGRLGEIQARLADAKAQLGALYGRARRGVVAGVQATDETIRTHPYQSLAVALGIGVLLGALISRRCGE